MPIKEPQTSLIGCERIHCSNSPIGDEESQQKEGEERIKERGHDVASSSVQGRTMKEKQIPSLITFMRIYAIYNNNYHK